MKQIVACIPARYEASRFPGKLLADLGGKPVIAHVIERARAARSIEDVLVATDDERIARTVASLGVEAVMTSRDHGSGTDRVAEAVKGRQCSIVVNVQGDEPFIDPRSIDLAVEPLIRDQKCQMATLIRPLTDPGELYDASVVKVVRDMNGLALYFSRSPIPFFRDRFPDPGKGRAGDVPQGVWAHVGIYVYRKRTLLDLVKWGPCDLELAERLEQLRALHHGVRIATVAVKDATVSIDTPADLERARAMLGERARG